jgi:hypothetical protein
MKKLAIISFIVLAMMTTNAQTKKEQIAQLAISYDSLNNLLEVERNNFRVNINEFNSIFQQQKSEIDTLRTEIVQLNKQIERKQKELILKQAEIEMQVAKLDSLSMLLMTQIKEHELSHLITDKGVMNFFIGDYIPEKIAGYKITKSIKNAEEGIEEPIINIADNSVELLQISCEYDYEKGKFTSKIGEILVKEKRFRTEKNIGVESTIDDFISSYPNYYMWYSYISGIYVIQSEDMGIQFLLDDKSYIGKKDLMEGDMIELEKGDFSSNTVIVGIRIY